MYTYMVHIAYAYVFVHMYIYRCIYNFLYMYVYMYIYMYIYRFICMSLFFQTACATHGRIHHLGRRSVGIHGPHRGLSCSSRSIRAASRTTCIRLYIYICYVDRKQYAGKAAFSKQTCCRLSKIRRCNVPTKAQFQIERFTFLHMYMTVHIRILMYISFSICVLHI